jgi:Polysaccharide biosynthesis enzyme WcbI
MQRVVVVGNCQASALELMLRTNEEFTKRFELVSFPPVHEFPDAMVPALHQAVAEADVLVPQRIEDGYRNGMGLGTDTLAAIAQTSTVVRWPSIYWAGYFPDLFYLRDAGGAPVLDGPFDYHDRSILRAYAEGLDVQATCLLLEDAERPSDACAWAAETTAELDVRGQDCDVQVAQFIASRFRDELLFFTMNHPTNSLLAFIAQQITTFLGISGSVDPRLMPGEVLGSTFYPLHANDVRALELNFGAEFGAGHSSCRIRGVSYKPADAVEMFFRYYEAYPQLVELNRSLA